MRSWLLAAAVLVAAHPRADADPTRVRSRAAVTTCKGFSHAVVEPRGSRSAQAVRAAIELHRPRVAHCYQQAIQRDPDTAGTLTATWMLTDAGTVEAVHVDGTLTDRGLAACVTAVVARMTFDPSEDGPTRIIYPFRFTRSR